MGDDAVSPHKLGLVLATFVGGWHIAWSLLVLLGWAKPVLSFVLWLHFIAIPYEIGPFVPWRAMILVAVTTAVGYVFGRVLGAIWNWVHTSGG